MIAAQVCSGLAYLNEAPRRIIHMDLKPANCLFDTFGQVKLTVRHWPALGHSRAATCMCSCTCWACRAGWLLTQHEQPTSAQLGGSQRAFSPANVSA